MAIIYIDTFFMTDNYGSQLQSLALSRYLEGLGNKVFFLERFKVASYAIMHPSLLIGRIRYLMGAKKRKQFFQPSSYLINEKRRMRLEEFRNKNYNRVLLSKGSDWKRIVKQQTVFVAGSDIIWNPANGYPTSHFLDFAITANLPCFSYATSIGAKSLPKKYHSAYKKYLGKYKCISMREQSAIDMLAPIINRKITKVIDPTFLLSTHEWNTIAEMAELSIPLDSSGYVLCYFVMDDNRYWRYVHQVAEKTCKQVVVLPMHNIDECQPYTVVMDGTPYEFLWLIIHASIVITDSFHACCFATQFEKEFYLLRRTREDENDKYSDFLSRYNLESQLVLNEDSFKYNNKTNFEIAHNKIEEDRNNSYIYLQEALRGL